MTDRLQGMVVILALFAALAVWVIVGPWIVESAVKEKARLEVDRWIEDRWTSCIDLGHDPELCDLLIRGVGQGRGSHP